MVTLRNLNRSRSHAFALVEMQLNNSSIICTRLSAFQFISDHSHLNSLEKICDYELLSFPFCNNHRCTVAIQTLYCRHTR